MKNEEFSKDFERLLKSKMDEMAESVECFDKISERAFPADNEDFSESGFTVTDLETISHDTKKHRIIKWTALAGAAAAAIIILPKTGVPQRVFMHFNDNSAQRGYEAILGEIESQTKDGSYYVMDVPLDYYIENDILVTPLMSCPFEENNRDDANVRLYIKQIDGWDTNQVYAVEYLGTYSENNIVAAAKSRYTITAEDLEHENTVPVDTKDLAETSVYSCFQDTKEGCLLDIDGNFVSVASFEYKSVVKDENGIRWLKTEVLYGERSSFGKDASCFYDIITHTTDGKPDIPGRDKMWETSLDFNGNSVFPTENGSVYTRETLFTENATWQYLDYAAMPVSEDWVPPLGKRIGLRASALQNMISYVTCPMNFNAAINLKIYFSTESMILYEGENQKTAELVECSGGAPVALYEYSADDLNKELFDAEDISAETEADMKLKAMQEQENQMFIQWEDIEIESARYEEAVRYEMEIEQREPRNWKKQSRSSK